ncbi:hypothetical protein [Oceanobacillus oncorhynchi]|uniref:hypothetical protein n=1 Tax=Oceanobacillus oncorhynchi TaxID=545501 RepID=UPI0025A4B528|nr:hypothetical protein [Oceanobacillus oncorhynchi]MDM8098675.1 hypothetical protein [Oceanobacillus oncorhynchi]
MKFFEANYPYYALIKAKDEKAALSIYEEQVADIDEGTDLGEIDENKALIVFAQSPGENENKIPSEEIHEEFFTYEEKVLLIDGSLL